MRSSLAALAGLLLLTTAAEAKVDITVDKNAQMMTVAVDGAQRYQWPVSTGNPSHETPNGTFRTFRMEADHFSKEFDDAPMPHSIFFTKMGHAMHGTESESRLGTPVSHGCVRLSRANATTLYALVEKEGVLNTTVTLTGSSQIALARLQRSRATTDVATRGQVPRQYQAPQDQSLQDQSLQDQSPQDSAGAPVMLTPQGQTQYAPPVQRADDGYIYPADGSSNAAIYPAPPSARRRVYDAQSYPQQPYYDNRGYAPQYVPPSPQPYYQPRGYYN